MAEQGIFKKKRVGIIGGNTPDPLSLAAAEKMGKLVAENGYILVNGGMGGVMEASARGAKSANGLVLSIIPGKLTDEANQYVDMVIATGLGYLRNALVVLNSDVLVAIDGKYGTLSEIAYAQIYNKKIYGLNTWNIQGIIHLSTPEEIINQINSFLGK